MTSRSKGKAFSVHHYAKTVFAKAETFNKKFSLDEYIVEMIGDRKKVKIADLGAGMFSTTGSILEGVEVNIHPSDELADEYMEVLKGQDIEPVFPIEKQNMEALTYSDESFDIVHCVNALDHCENPDKAIKEMYRICKPGGWIYLRHFFNVGKLQKYTGEHDWNITLTIDRDCIFWNNNACFLLSELVPGFVNESKKELDYEKYSMVVSRLQK